MNSIGNWYRQISGAHKFFFAVQMAFAALVIWWYQMTPEPSKADITIGVVAAFMSLQVDMKPGQKTTWFLLIACLVAIEFRAIEKDRQQQRWEDAQATAADRQSASRIEREIDVAMNHDEDQLEATTRHIESLVESEAELRGDTTLTRAMGGDGFPLFVPSDPPGHPPAGVSWPVRLVYDSRNSLPLMDVQVEVLPEASGSVTPGGPTRQPGLGVLAHPNHYALGNISPGTTVDAPFELQSGRRYRLKITTRKHEFYERVSIHTAPEAPTGWLVSTCTYRLDPQPTPAGMTVVETLVGGECAP